MTWFFIILTVGFLRLVFYWKPNWMLWCTHRKCSLAAATQLLLRVTLFTNTYDSYFKLILIYLTWWNKKKQKQTNKKDKYQQWYVEKVEVLSRPKDWWVNSFVCAKALSLSLSIKSNNYSNWVLSFRNRPAKDIDNENTSVNQESKQKPSNNNNSNILVKNSIFKDVSKIEQILWKQ